MQGLQLQFEPVFQNEQLFLSEDSSCDMFPCVSLFKAYLSHFELLHDDAVVWREDDSYHLIDAANPSSLELLLSVPSALVYDEIRFYLGIDSLTSVSGAFGGDLDPTKGMYWTWNSGYVHFKLEGKSGRVASVSKTFDFHLGGYHGPHAVFEKIELPFPNTSDATIRIDLDSWLREIDLKQSNKIMSPGAKANELAEGIPRIFSVYEKK